MGFNQTFTQRLVLGTVLGFILLFTIAILCYHFRTPQPLVLTSQGQPTMGSLSAPVEMVLFEDFLCVECRRFNQKIFPKIKSKYVANNQARFTLVIVSFLPGSKPLANAALAVYHIAPERFFDYVEALFHKVASGKLDGSQRSMLLELAHAVGGIDEKALRDAIDAYRYFGELDENLAWAQRLMGANFGTPALYINGVAIPTSNYKAIQLSIERAQYVENQESR